MEKKKISLSVFISTLAVLVIIIMAGFIYMQKINSEREIAGLKNDSEELKATVTELQGKLDSISNITDTSDKDGEYFILYNGCEMKIATGVAETSLLDTNQEVNQKYNTTYYNYENGKYLGETNGKVVENGIENTFIVDNVRRIAMSKKYNAIPRSFTKIKELPEELMDMADCTTVNIHSIDLDGDGTEEKIVCYTASEAEGDFDNSKPLAFSEILLFDSNYKKIATLVKLEDGFASINDDENSKVFLSLDNVEYIDIDNDGIMEIISELPQYESDGASELSIVKYNKGKIEGKTDVTANVRP